MFDLETLRKEPAFDHEKVARAVEGALADGKNLTVFAPTDEAFAALPAGTVENLLKPENKDKLAAVLSYHVVPKKIAASDIPGGTTEVATLKKAGNMTITAIIKINAAITNRLFTRIKPPSGRKNLRQNKWVKNPIQENSRHSI